MGMQGMRDELESLAFRHLMPDAYEMIESRLEDLRRNNGKIIAKIEKELADELAARGIDAQVEGRQKHPYSVWRKMERKSIAFEQLSDIYGFRVIVSSVEDCYRVIGVVHTKWAVVPGRFKDYISTPKQNDYQSIHTTVVGPGRQRAELQVRTAAMQDVARNGIAAHTLYKDGRVADRETLANESRAYQWLRRTIGLLAEGDTPEEFLEHTKLELFHDQVFCFTPKGRLIALPRGATPIDFAYAVHTDVGNSAVGAKINGSHAPLQSQLHNGDEVEIARAENQTPPAVWESIVITGKARSAIRRATRDAVRAQYAGLGRQIVVRAFERAAKAYSDDKLKKVLPRLARGSIEDVLAAVGRGEMFSGDVVKAVYPEFTEERKPPASPARGEAGWFGLQKAASLVFKIPGEGGEEHAGHSIPIRGIQGDLPVRFAPIGGAVPGDRIVGILTPGEGITIYPIQSPDLTAFDEQPERWLDVRWDIEDGRHEFFPARIMITAINEPGTLGTIATVIGDLAANIDNIVMNPLSADFREMIIDIEVNDLKHLNTIMSQLRARPVVSKVERVNG
jgi:GTP pyrophosphokinase